MTETILRKENKGEAEAMVKFLEEIGKRQPERILNFHAGCEIRKKLKQ